MEDNKAFFTPGGFPMKKLTNYNKEKHCNELIH